MASGKASSVRATLFWEDGESNFAANASPHYSRFTGRNGSKVEEEEEDNRVPGHIYYTVPNEQNILHKNANGSAYTTAKAWDLIVLSLK